MVEENKNKTFYLRSVTVNTSLGKRTLVYRHVQPTVDEDGNVRTNGVDCDKQCPYGKVCQYMPDPRKPDKLYDKDEPSAFCDFCADISLNIDNVSESEDPRVKNIDDIKSYVPEEGTIENNLGDIFPSILDIIREKNPIVRVSSVIDHVCDGICGYYNKEHSNCKFDNSMCLLRGLFNGPKKSTPMDIEENPYDTDRPNRVEPNPFTELVKETKKQ